MRRSPLWLVCMLAFGCGRLGFDDLAVASDDAPPPDPIELAYPTDDVNAVLGVTPVLVVPTFLGAPQFSIVPGLPAGLSIDADTGVIDGIPTSVTDGVVYTVTATAPAARATATITLTVLPGWTVDTFVDGADNDNGVDGLCSSPVAGGCSLRAAFQSANQRTPKQLILLQTGTYTLGMSLDTLGTDLVIAGRSATQTKVRPSVVHPGYGFVRIVAAHQLTLKKIAFYDFGMRDGGVVNATAGTTVVDACSFTNNRSAGSGGVFFFSNGAIAAIRRSTFTLNQSNGGSGWGGVVDGEGAGTTLVFEQCTATANEAPWGSFSHITTGTTLRLENSTLYANRSTIAGTLATPGGIYTLVNDTIVNNRNTNVTPNSAGLYLYNAPCHYTVSNTIVAWNTDVLNAPYNCNRRDLTTSLTSFGGNVFSSDAENCAAYFNSPTDHLATDPQLVAGEPTDNGGLTATILPAPTSMVLGIASACPAVDQRGKPRSPMPCDAGAVELP